MSTKRININTQIRAPEMRVVGPEGKNLGVLSLKDALDAAKQAGLDLIEISPTATPPIAKIMDYGKYQYQEQKKEREVKAKSHVTETKSIQITVTEGENDLMRKAKSAADWLKEGHRVKIELYLKGRYKYMNQDFLKEKLDRFVLLIPGEYKIAEPVTRGPKGFLVTIERSGKK
ncbi:MAG: translation initiation factor IF-3 [Patescibacteria group bacterium]